MARGGQRAADNGKLIVDATTESIVNDNQVSQLLARGYRKPFVVPDKV